MLLGLTLVASCLAVWPSTARKQRDVVQVLREQNDVLEVLYEHEIQRDASGTAIAKFGRQSVKSDVPPWMIDSVGVDFFHDAVCVWLIDSCSKTTLRHLKQLPNLQEVHCIGCTSKEFRRLEKALPEVRVVD